MEKQLKILVFIGVCILIGSGALLIAEGPNKPETGHYSNSEFHHVQDYYGWGPACYYGQNVRVVYDATNTWTYVLHQGSVRETLVQSGTAEIYSLPGDVLLDVRAFTVTERFFDKGVDVAIRHDYGTSVWYQASHNPYSADLEEYQYIWEIPGVYDFRVWNRNGDVSWGWKSGDCEAGGPTGWPPQPPYPFSK